LFKSNILYLFEVIIFFIQDLLIMRIKGSGSAWVASVLTAHLHLNPWFALIIDFKIIIFGKTALCG